MFNNPKVFTNISKLTQTIELADRSTILASGTGTVWIKLSLCLLDLSDCLLVENLLYSLISLGQILKPNYKLTSYKNKTFQVLDQNDNLIIKGSFKGGNFEVNTENELALTTISHSNQSLTLHQAAGHPSPEYLNKMFPKANVKNFLCDSCNLCKITKYPFKGSFPLSQQKLQFLHMDLFRPVETLSNLGYKYCLRVMDGFSHFVWTLFLKSKSEISFLLQKLFTQIENQSHAKIINIISDNGSEFENEKLNNLLQAKGITHLTTAPYTLQKNPTATYLENITPKRSRDHSTPFSKSFERTPTYHHLQPFGCLCYYLNNLIRGKLTDRGSEGIFLGYEEGHLAYRILDRRTGNVKITHHIKFVPNLFPGKLSNPTNMEADQLQLRTDLNQTLATKHEEGNPPQKNNLEMGSPTPPESNLKPDPVEYLPEVIPSRAKPPSLSRSDDPEPNPSRLTKGKSPRYEWIPENEPPPKEILGKVGDPRNVMESRRRPKHTANAVSLLDEECPKNFHQAMKSDLHQHWEDAIQKELDNM
ncbi:hypothetical protein O181_090172 [Austropuccinia psidii MF-1]|uniref:Integrase catalytic domain-containing protein n=1 Tax=Austropuccinia psidii MF-1 TaxID=1389203 RepID=A0A9Q3IV10_9BASI|nr:hypothetical protein [Austropuccinia psidii MF-1]